MKKISLLLTSALIISAPHYSFAWGKAGHGIVAEIAFSILDSKTQLQVKKYLDTTTIEQASTWMDEVRGDHAYDYMKPWHYVNVEQGSTYLETKDDNIINALNAAIERLQHRNALTNDEIKKNLMIIFHLVGDFHQPLHVGYASDKGGNDIKVQYLGKPANLHWVWDTEIIESEKITFERSMALYQKMNKKELKTLKVVNVQRWIAQPRILLSNVYDFQNNILDQAYADRNEDIIEKQLVVAGIRLAAVLELVFKS